MLLLTVRRSATMIEASMTGTQLVPAGKRRACSSLKPAAAAGQESRTEFSERAIESLGVSVTLNGRLWPRCPRPSSAHNVMFVPAWSTAMLPVQTPPVKLLEFIGATAGGGPPIEKLSIVALLRPARPTRSPRLPKGIPPRVMVSSGTESKLRSISRVIESPTRRVVMRPFVYNETPTTAEPPVMAGHG